MAQMVSASALPKSPGAVSLGSARGVVPAIFLSAQIRIYHAEDYFGVARAGAYLGSFVVLAMGGT